MKTLPEWLLCHVPQELDNLSNQAYALTLHGLGLMFGAARGAPGDPRESPDPAGSEILELSPDFWRGFVAASSSLTAHPEPRITVRASLASLQLLRRRFWGFTPDPNPGALASLRLRGTSALDAAAILTPSPLVDPQTPAWFELAMAAEARHHARAARPRGALEFVKKL